MSDGQREKKETLIAPAIDPTAFVAPSANVLGDVTIGAESSVWYQCVLRGDIAPIVIGERTNVQDLTLIHVDRGLSARVGNEVGIGHRAIIHGCTIEDHALIGMGAIVLSGAIIGEGSVVGAGSLITEGMVVPSGQLVIGVPARVVRPVDDDLRERIAMTVDNYARLKELYRQGRFSAVNDPH